MFESIIESELITWLLTDYDGWMTLFCLVVLPSTLIKERKLKKRRMENYKKCGLSIVSRQSFLSWADTGYVVIVKKRSAFNFQRDMVRGKYKGFNVGLFTHLTDTYSTAATRRQTVVVLELEKHIPDFVLRPTWVRDKIKSSFGTEDINFPTHKTFSKKYFLSCDGEENIIRKCFNDPTLDYFSDNLNLWVEINNGKLFAFRENELLRDGSKLEGMLDRAVKIYGLFEGVQD